MPHQVPVIEVRFLSKLGSYLHDRGVSIDEVLHDVGLDAALLEHPWTVIPLSVAGRILDLLAKLLDDKALGLHFGANVAQVSTGILGQLMMAAPTVRDMLATLAEYHELHVRQVDITYAETISSVRIEIGYPATFQGSQTQLTSFFVSSVVAAVRVAAGARWTPRLVEFEHRAPGNLTPYLRTLGPRLKFGRPTNAVTLDRAVAGLRLPPSPAGLFEALREAADRLKSDDVTVHDITNQVHREISSRLATGEPFGLDDIAGTLGLTARALQYRLELHATSYEAILVETRRRLAERYLRDTDLAITEISDRLGFSELSAFTRAAQRWFAMPPRSYRNHMRGRPLPPNGRAVKAMSQPGRGGSARRNLAGSGSAGPRSSRP